MSDQDRWNGRARVDALEARLGEVEVGVVALFQDLAQELRTQRLVIVDQDARARLTADVRDGIVRLELSATDERGRNVRVSLWADEGEHEDDAATASIELIRDGDAVREWWVSGAG